MRYALAVEYDGTDFHGWQKQHAIPSVQAELEKAIAQIAAHPIETICAGRTDKGVHALQQIIHFDSTAIRSDYAWLRGINRYLPPTISVHWIKSVPDDFHARYSATARRYVYVIHNSPIRPSLTRHRVTWVYRPLNVIAMRQAANYLLGEHDFSSFRGSDCQAITTQRTVYHLELIQQGSLLMLDIKANAFLHHMVRNIAGSLIAVGLGAKAPSWIAEVLAACDRRAAATTAHPQGLYFTDVDYPAEFQLPKLNLLPF